MNLDVNRTSIPLITSLMGLALRVLMYIQVASAQFSEHAFHEAVGFSGTLGGEL